MTLFKEPDHGATTGTVPVYTPHAFVSPISDDFRSIGDYAAQGNVAGGTGDDKSPVNRVTQDPIGGQPGDQYLNAQQRQQGRYWMRSELRKRNNLAGVTSTPGDLSAGGM